MTQRSLNTSFIVVGLILLLGGLLLHEKDVLSIALAGVGGSVLATGLVNLALNFRKETLPWLQPIERFAQQLDFMRTNHKAEIYLEALDGEVKVRKQHRFTLVNPYPWSRKRDFVLSTDASCAPSGGFICVTEPDDTILEGEHLRRYVDEREGQYVFRKQYKIQPGSENSFDFQSTEVYRRRDRLIWTVQDFSDDFYVKIYCPGNSIQLKINHHQENSIRSRCEHIEADGATILHFNCEVFPYQGFELWWNFDQQADT